MKGVYIYPQDCEDFTTTGMVGDIHPILATFTEEKNGLAYIKCEVPVRVPPVISDDQYANTVEVQEPT